MYEQVLICILKILNFVSVFPFIFEKKFLLWKNEHGKYLEFSKCAYIFNVLSARVIFSIFTQKKIEKFYPSSAGNIWVLGHK